MNFRLHLLLLIPLGLVMAGCESTTKDTSGFSEKERLEALQSGTVLPGMTAAQVQHIWGAPQKKAGSAGNEEWIYFTGAAGSGFDVHTSVKFSQGKVSDIVNGDLMAGRDRSREAIPDMAPNMSRGGGMGIGGSTNPSSFQALPGPGY